MNKINLAKVTGYQVDSRRVASGNLFFALEGKKVHGIDFLEQISKYKNVIAVVPGWYSGDSFGLPLIYVDDVLAVLGEFAKRSLNDEFIIGVTGSLGKTTTKEFIWQLIRESFPCDKSPGNQNSQIGLPLSILNRDRSAKILVLEYGISELGNMEGLLNIAIPDLGILTKIAGVHMESLGDIKNIAKEKKKLLAAAKNSICPISWNKDLTGLTVGAGGDIWLESEGEELFIVEKSKRSLVKPSFHEEHFLEDMLIAYAAGRAVGIDSEVLLKRCQKLTTPKMRYEKVQKNGMTIVKDMYNASVESNKIAIKCLPKPSGIGKKIGVLGQMAELGHNSDQLHFTVGKYAEDKLDYLLLLGEKAVEIQKGFAKSNKPCFHFTNKEELIVKLKQILIPGDVILIKGSRFLEMENIYQEVFEDK